MDRRRAQEPNHGDRKVRTVYEMAMLEVACFNKESAAVACEAGADRIELCENGHLGGTTPATATVKEVIVSAKSAGIPVNVMIRPRGGEFNYTDSEFEEMEASIRNLKSSVDGFVLGVLKSANTVDIERTAALVQVAHPLPCTFHRAFDEVSDLCIGLEDVITSGCASLLSSGGAANASEGATVLGDLARRADRRLTIIAGGSVRSTNLASIAAAAKTPVYHTSALLPGTDVAASGEIVQMKAILKDSQGVSEE